MAHAISVLFLSALLASSQVNALPTTRLSPHLSLNRDEFAAEALYRREIGESSLADTSFVSRSADGSASTSVSSSSFVSASVSGNISSTASPSFSASLIFPTSAIASHSSSATAASAAITFPALGDPASVSSAIQNGTDASAGVGGQTVTVTTTATTTIVVAVPGVTGTKTGVVVSRTVCGSGAAAETSESVKTTATTTVASASAAGSSANLKTTATTPDFSGSTDSSTETNSGRSTETSSAASILV